MSNSVQPHGLLPTRILWTWDSLGRNTGVGCHFLLQRIFLTQEDGAQVPYIAGRFFTIWGTGKFLENTDGHFNRQSWWICDAWKDVYFLPGLSWIWLLVQRSDVGAGLWLCSGLRLNAVLRVLQALDLYNNNMSVMPTWKGWRPCDLWQSWALEIKLYQCKTQIWRFLKKSEKV